MEQELSFGPLLDKDGNLSQRGFAYSLIKEYKRKDIKGTKSRIKEWDYYYIADSNYGIALTIDDNSYMVLYLYPFWISGMEKRYLQNPRFSGSLTEKQIYLPPQKMGIA